MTTHTKKRVALLSLIAFIVGIGIVAVAVQIGEQMQKLPPFYKMGMLIEIESNS